MTNCFLDLILQEYPDDEPDRDSREQLSNDHEITKQKFATLNTPEDVKKEHNAYVQSQSKYKIKKNKRLGHCTDTILCSRNEIYNNRSKLCASDVMRHLLYEVDDHSTGYS